MAGMAGEAAEIWAASLNSSACSTLVSKQEQITYTCGDKKHKANHSRILQTEDDAYEVTQLPDFIAGACWGGRVLAHTRKGSRRDPVSNQQYCWPMRVCGHNELRSTTLHFVKEKSEFKASIYGVYWCQKWNLLFSAQKVDVE